MQTRLFSSQLNGLNAFSKSYAYENDLSSPSSLTMTWTRKMNEIHRMKCRVQHARKTAMRWWSRNFPSGHYTLGHALLPRLTRHTQTLRCVKYLICNGSCDMCSEIRIFIRTNWEHWKEWAKKKRKLRGTFRNSRRVSSACLGDIVLFTRRLTRKSMNWPTFTRLTLRKRRRDGAITY